MRRNETWAAVGLAVAGVLLVFGGLLAGETLFYSDYGLLYHPLKRWAVERLAAGEWPTWNPDLALGLPQHANPIVGTFYPPHLLLLVLPLDPGLGILVVLHYGLALAGAARVLRGWGGVLAGVAFALGGAMVSATAWGFMIFAWAWTPWAAAGALAVAGGRWWGGPVVALAVAMAALAGSPPAALFSGLLALALVARKRGLQAPLLVAAALALAVGLSAAQLLPSAWLLPESVRAGGALGAEGVWSLAPVRLLGFLLPDVWGQLAPEPTFWGHYLTDGLSDGNFFYYSHYLGVVPLALAPAAFVRSTRGLAAVLLAAVVACLLVALGRHTPVYPWLVDYVPGVGLFRYPERWILPSSLMLALLGGLGLRALERNDAPRWAIWSACGVIGLAAVVMLASDEAARGWIGGHAPAPLVDAARRAQVLGALQALGAAILCAALVWRRPRWWAPALVALALAEVVVQGRGLVWTAPPEVLESARPMVEQLAQAGDEGPVARHPGLDAQTPLHRDLDGLIALSRRAGATLRGNLALEAGGRVLHVESPARLNHPAPPEQWIWSDPARAGRVLGVRHLLVPLEAPVAGGLRPVARLPALGVMVLATAADPFPGAFCIGATVEVSTEQVVEALEAVDPTRTAVVEGDAGGLSGRSAWPCAQVIIDPGRVDVRVSLEDPALLVIQQAWSGGWEATVDGDAHPVRRAYGSLMAVSLAAGEHAVTLRYTAPGLEAGLWISGLAVLIWFGWCGWGWRRRTI